MEAYDAGLVNHRDPVNVKFRNQAEEKMKLQEAEQYVDPAKAEEGALRCVAQYVRVA